MPEPTLDLLSRLHKEATPGEWSIENGKVQGDRFFATVHSYTARQDAANAALIVAMRNALPALLRVVEAAEKACEQFGPKGKGALLGALSALNETGA